MSDRVICHITRTSADADKPSRCLQRSVKVTKHSTIPYARYSFLLLCNSNFVLKMHHFSDNRLQKCCDLEIRVRGHSKSLKVVPTIQWIGYGFLLVLCRNFVPEILRYLPSIILRLWNLGQRLLKVTGNVTIR